MVPHMGPFGVGLKGQKETSYVAGSPISHTYSYSCIVARIVRRRLGGAGACSVLPELLLRTLASWGIGLFDQCECRTNLEDRTDLIRSRVPFVYLDSYAFFGERCSHEINRKEGGTPSPTWNP